jgi:exopolysaccharide production protein ExoZ
MKQNLFAVQSLRAIAAIAVVAYHSAATIRNFGWTPGALSDASKWGWAGVDIFFFISGFVMVIATTGQRRGPLAAKDFMVARLMRIVPMYWILTSLMLAILWVVPSLKHFEFTTTEILDSYFFVPYEVAGEGNVYPVLYVGWTLIYEMFFYLVFAISICFPERAMRWALPAFFAVLSILSLTSPTPYIYRFLTSPLLLEFVFGAVFAWIYRSGYRLSTPGFTALIVFGIIGFLVLTPGSSMDHRVVTAGIPAALLVSGAVLWESAGGWAGGTWLSTIGDASYSLYLLQAFTVPGFARLVSGIDKHRILPGDVACLLIVSATVVVSMIVYRVVERKIDVKLRALRRRTATRPAALDRSA